MQSVNWQKLDAVIDEDDECLFGDENKLAKDEIE